MRFAAIIDWLLRVLSRLARKAKLLNGPTDETGRVNREVIIKDVYSEIGLSIGYFATLVIANLVALGGLLTNSAAVVIGAMLISPLMSPILAVGFAFATAADSLLFKAARKIILSVLLVIAVSAFATWVSPLKEATAEIVARTRPNLYDLVIAFLAGTAGAAALCTRKNYLTIVPGVAIATAVIPPLSVVGFGIGTGDFSIAFGSFFLFFVNLVAIVLATFLVLYAYGFRPSQTGDLSQNRRRIAILFSVLFVISIPLFYTVHKTAAELRLRNNLGSILTRDFNKERESSLRSFEYNEDRKGKGLVTALVYTVDYIKQDRIDQIEQSMRRSLKRDLNLYVEQVKVQPGGLKEAKGPKPSGLVLAPVRLPQDILKTARENTLSVIKIAIAKMGDVIVPSRIDDFWVTFGGQSTAIALSLKVRRDIPFSEEETRWFENLLSRETGIPLLLRVDTEPWVPPLLFKRGQTVLTDEMRSSLGPLKAVFDRDSAVSIRVEAFPEPIRSRQEKHRLAKQRIEAIEKTLTSEFSIPPSQVTTVIHKETSKVPSVRVSVEVRSDNTARGYPKALVPEIPKPSVYQSQR